jgi:hypothetical protein
MGQNPMNCMPEKEEWNKNGGCISTWGVEQDA